MGVRVPPSANQLLNTHQQEHSQVSREIWCPRSAANRHQNRVRCVRNEQNHFHQDDGCSVHNRFIGLATADCSRRPAEHLPVKTYTTADGLPRDSVTHIKQDSRGFIWMIAGDGISRFDGYTFTNYTTDDGLPDRRVNDLLETRTGEYWIATESGLCRFNPHRRPFANCGFSIAESKP